MGKWQRIMFQPGVGIGENGARVTACKEHRQLSKEAAKEGMVLLKNNRDVLPLAKGTRVAMFGKATFDYVKGGGGSGDVTVEYITNLYEGFEKMGLAGQVHKKTADFYRHWVEKQYEAGIEPGMTKEPELPDDICQEGRSFADTAIISICRFSGEGWDRKSKYDERMDENAVVIAGNTKAAKETEKETFPEGDFYLTKEERDMVQKVKQTFDRVVVVLNVGGMVDTNWFAKDDDIDAVLLAWQGGMEGGLAAAELLMGQGNPSGKLPDTFAEKLEDYPSSYNFHESDQYVNYTDDIYVGYRYFETIPGAAEKVNYPFGYGLSYTTFAWSVLSVREELGKITTDIQVTNTGKYAGKEVLQMYGEAPQGVLGKSKRHLLTFGKTRLLQQGETQQITLVFDIADMASYDDLGKIQKSAYLLEKGEYSFYLGNSVRDARKLEYTYVLGEDRVVEQLSAKLVPTSLPERMMADGSMEPVPQSPANDPYACGLPFLAKEPLDGLKPSTREVQGTYCWGEDLFKKGVRPFSEVAEGKMTPDEFLAQMTDEEVMHLLGGQPNTGVANTFGWGNMPEYGIPNCMTADGPAGLRIAPECGVNTTAWPCATLLASTWNDELVYEVGAAGGKEVRENNIAAWLTPALNIHRSPLCGRNFEYYSEDPLLAGRLACAMVEGIQSQHIAATVKHFALNNKETDRKHSDSRVSERAAREIYLKGFEYIVKHGKPWAIMSSYNIINGYYASENKELLEDILRDEWGFDGMVTTDWWTMGEHYKEVKAGNDMKMGCGDPKRLKEALEQGLLTRQDLEHCAKRVLALILKFD
ncbi:MAG: glycoside hydrolase family 3 C-terminal domain-containing protein [Eubacterium sp.]|nr:glycoside hydrolase family 3 C-terminal domain-containing protein [Eubacterium sp.]